MLERAENEGFEGQKRTKMPILCSGMVAASLAAPIGAQHYPPRALRGASGSSTPGNRLPQPTTQPAVVHATAEELSPCMLPQPAAKTYLPLILPRIPPWLYRRGATAKNYRRVLPPRNYPRATYPPGILPCSGSRAQRAGDSDVGANDKGAGDNPGDGVDAH